MNDVTKVEIVLAKIGIVVSFQVHTKGSNRVCEQGELGRIVGFSKVSQGFEIHGGKPVMFEELVDELQEHGLILIRTIEPGFIKSQRCPTQCFDKAASFLGCVEPGVSVAFSHKGSNKTSELKRIAVIGDGKSRFCRRKLVEFGDVGVEFRHSGPDFMRAELF